MAWGPPPSRARPWEPTALTGVARTRCQRRIRQRNGGPTARNRVEIGFGAVGRRGETSVGRAGPCGTALFVGTRSPAAGTVPTRSAGGSLLRQRDVVGFGPAAHPDPDLQV